ncbi:hypothetical protein M378DRAFT_27853, partial [Amanita muscaria Koide BX008]
MSSFKGAKTKASREVLRIVQDVLKEPLSSNGLNAAEVFNLATRKLPKPAYLPWTEGVGRSPNPGYPMRSM